MALTKVTGDFIKDGVLTQAHLHSSHGITSTHIGEGDKLFFTNARARGAISVSGNALSYNSSTGVITSNFEESPTFTGDVTFQGGEGAVQVIGSGNQDIKIGSTGSGWARIYLDGSNGDFSGSDYIYIGQNDDKSVHFYTSSLAGTTTFTSKGVTNLVMDGANSTFSGNIVINGSGSSGNALNVTRGSDGATALRVQNTGEVVTQANYFYATGPGTSMYVQNTAVFRGAILNDGSNADVRIADNLTVEGTVKGDIYYDRNNTGYYLNPESWSYIYGFTNEVRYGGGSYSDPDPGVTRDAKFGNNGIAAASGKFTGALVGTTATFSGNVTLSSTGNHYQGHFYYDPYSADGAHYPHFLDGSNGNGVDINWRLYTGSSSYLTHIWNTTKARFVTRIESSIDMRAPVFYDINNTAYYAHLDDTGTSIRAAGTVHASLSNMSSYQLNGTYVMDSSRNLVNINNITASQLTIDDYIYHAGDTHTYFGFTGNDAFAMVFEGTTRLSVADSSDPVFSYNAHINMNNKDIDYVNQLHFGSNVRFYDEGNDNYLNFKFGDTSYGGIKMLDGSGNVHGYFYADGDDSIGILDSGGSWAVQIDNDNVTALKVQDTYRLKCTTSEVHTYGNLHNDSSLRAPIFYDSNDTSFYLDPKNSDRALKTYGSVSIGTVGHLGLGDTSHPKVVYPGKEASWDGSGSTTGMVVITLPGTLAHYDMMYMEIDVYEYSGDNASKIIIGGHNWNSGGNSNTSTTMWYNTGAKVIGSFSKPIYFGWRNDGTNNRRVIVLGETNSSWSYGTVHVSKVSGACYYADSIDYMGDWVVEQTTSSSYYTKSPTTNHNSTNSPTLITYGSVRGSVFYDINNTSYYINPDSTTSLRTVGSWRSDSSTWDGEFNGKIQHHGSYWYLQSANGVLVRNSSGANNIQLSGSGIGTASNDWRAPQFYDSADTSYYLDANGTSRLNKINMTGAGAQGLNITSTDIRSSATSTWTGNPGANGKIQYHSNRWYIVSDSSSNRILQFRMDGSDKSYIDNNGSYVNGHYIYAYTFYDRNDTNYYIDPASNSVMNTINGFGFSQTGGNGKILVTNSSNGYLYLNNWIYVDGAGLFTSTNGAHLYANTCSDYGTWRMNGTRNGWNGITFDVNGCNNTLMASEHTMGFYNDANNEWMLECQRNSHTRLYYNGSEQAKTDNGYFSINNVLHTPIAYDSNNTGYYFDGAGTSRMDTIMLRSTINFPTNSPGVSHGSSHRPAYAIYQEGGAWSHPFPDLCIAMHTGIKLGANGSYNGIRFYDDYTMATQVMSINNNSDGLGGGNVFVNNSLQANSSLRSLIFYDSGNTNYYCDPASTSKLSTIEIGASGYSNIWMGGQSGNYFRFHTNNSHTYFDGNVGDIHWRQGSSTRFIFYMTTANMTVNGTVTQYSDSRLKDNIITIDGALDKVNQLRGVYYNRTDINTSERQIGLVAQEVESIVPEVVHTANDELNTKSISYAQLNALLVEAIKEQQTIIDDLKSRIETLENQ